MAKAVNAENYEFNKRMNIGVTGANGYIGRHIVLSLLREGMNVTATLRDLTDSTTLRADIRSKVEYEENGVKFVGADLLNDNGWESALEGCSAVVHTASPFPNRPPKSGNELIEIAEYGTERVLRAAYQAGVTRIILTSSVAAIMMGSDRNDHKPFDETNWSDPNHERADTYSISKLRAEQRAWQLAKEFGLELTVLNPGLVFGCPIGESAGTSVGIIKRIFNGKDLALPDASFPCVDVADVARAHVLALQTRDCVGHRIILSQETLAIVDIAKLLHKAFPSKRIATSLATAMMVKTAARFDPELQVILPFIGFHPQVSTEKARDLLKIEFSDVKTSILETARSFIFA